MKGRNQAVRLPKNCRFTCEEVFIRKDEKTGDFINSRKPDSWDDFFQKANPDNITADFMSDRETEALKEVDLI